MKCSCCNNKIEDDDSIYKINDEIYCGDCGPEVAGFVIYEYGNDDCDIHIYEGIDNYVDYIKSKIKSNENSILLVHDKESSRPYIDSLKRDIRYLKEELKNIEDDE